MKNLKTPPLIRAALYIRVSSEEQVMRGYSLEAQEEALTRYAKEHELLIAGIYVDEGKSARGNIKNRKAFQRLMADVQADKIDLILFIKLDRWFRSVKDYYKTQEILEKHRVNWRATEEQYDTSTANGRLYINIRLALAQDEADRTSERIKFVQAAKVARREVISGKVPMGFRIEHKHLVHDPEKIDMVRDLFAHYQAYNNKRGTVRYIFQKYGVAIESKNLTKMLSNTLYKGEYRGIKDFCEPIIASEVWEQVNAVKNVRYPPTGRVYIFAGLIICAACGYRMAGRYAHTTIDGKEVIYYRCARYVNYRACANSILTKETIVENWLLENIESEIKTYLYQAQSKAARQPKPKINRAAIRRKLARLKDLYVNEMIDLETYKADYQTYAAQLTELQETQTPTVNTDALKAFLNGGFDRTVYQGMSREEKRALWRSVIKEIRIDAQHNVTLSFVENMY